MSFLFLAGGFVMGLGAGILLMSMAVAAARADEALERLAAGIEPNEDALA